MNARQYAQLRANETGTPYIVSGWDDLNGHHERALWDCPNNRKAIELLGDTIYLVARPTAKARLSAMDTEEWKGTAKILRADQRKRGRQS